MKIQEAKPDPDARVIYCMEGAFFVKLGPGERTRLPPSVTWLSLGLALRRFRSREFWSAEA